MANEEALKEAAKLLQERLVYDELSNAGVVHCKDCKHAHRLPEALTCRRLTHRYKVKDDDYCSYGERKEK